MPLQQTHTDTVQFRLQDVRFFQAGSILSHHTPMVQLRQADAVRLYIDNQKNGQRGSTMHHTARAGPFCPVKALANRVTHLYSIAWAMVPLPLSAMSTLALMSPRLKLPLLSGKASYWRASSIPATAPLASPRTLFGPAGPWPSDSTTLAKILSKNWGNGQAPPGSLTSRHKSLCC
jgi:hypothetical protein